MHIHTSVHSHVFTRCCLVAASSSGRSPSSAFPNCPRPQLPDSHSNSSQRLNLNSPLTNSLTHSPTNNSLTHSPTNNSLIHSLTHSLTHQPITLQFTGYPAYKISARTAQETLFLCCCIQLFSWKHASLTNRYLVTVVVYLLISPSLSGNGCTYHNINFVPKMVPNYFATFKNIITREICAT
jgi:hypothetical protein